MNNTNFGRVEIIAIITAVVLTVATFGGYLMKTRAQAQEAPKTEQAAQPAAGGNAEGPAEQGTPDQEAAEKEAAEKEAAEKAAKEAAEREAAEKAAAEKEAEEQAKREAEEAEQKRAEAEAALQQRREEAQQAVAQMSLEDKVSRLFLVTPEALTGADLATVAGDMTRRALDQYPVGGIVYAAQNIENREQITALLSGTEEFSSYPVFLAAGQDIPADGEFADAGFNMQMLGNEERPASAEEAEALGEQYAEENRAVCAAVPAEEVNADLTANMNSDEALHQVLVAGDLINQENNGAYAMGQAAVAAIDGGADLLLVRQEFQAVRQAVLNAVWNGQLTEEKIDEALIRVYTAY